VKAKTQKIKKAKVERPKVTTKSVKAKVQKQAPKRSSEARKKIVMPEDMFGTISVPEDRAVPFGAITPAPIKQQELFITSNWRIVRPVIDHEKCTLCLTCYISCPDSCWSFNEQEEKMEWNWKFCKGCQICINECPADALKAVPELDFEDGVVRLEKPF
jgi:pyruvate ferredoxin oxidoreductase delta subunit